MQYMYIDFTALDGQELIRKDSYKPKSNSVGYLKARFKFSTTEHTGIITAHFKAMLNHVLVEETMDLVDNECFVPESMIKNCNLYVYLTSTSDTSHIPTNECKVEIKPSGELDTELPLPDQTNNQYQDTILKHTEVMQKAVEVAENATEAELSKVNAYNSEVNAKASEIASKASEDNAKASETNAATRATTATEQAGIATTKANEAYTSATNAATSATSASNSASTATTKAGEASTSATNAANSASQAAGYVTEITNSRASAVKGKTFAAVDDRLEELDADTYFPMTNLGVNTDFSNGTTGWTSSTSALSVVSNVLIATASGSAATFSVVQSSPTLSGTKKIYIKAMVQIPNGSPNSVDLYYYAGSGGIGSSVIAQVLNPIAGNWYMLSGVATVTRASGSNYSIRCAYPDATTANGKIMNIKYVVFKDLSITFGSGNEPTAIQEDDILSFYDNSWFNGTVNLAKNIKMFSYLLKNIRSVSTELVNIKQAIIALGGTV